MKRAARHILFFGLLGVVVSYLVAWALSAWPRPPAAGQMYILSESAPLTIDLDGSLELQTGSTSAYLDGEPVLLESLRTLRLGVERLYAWYPLWVDSVPPEAHSPWVSAAITHLMSETAELPPNENAVYCLEASGFPCLCVHVDAYEIPGKHTVIVGGTSLPPSKAVWLDLDDDIRLIGFRPLWPGLAINAAAYGGLLWCMLFLPGAVRGAWRRQKGWCRRCGYDRRGDERDVCPECGQSDRARLAS